jgi:HSP20 family protein
MEMTTAISKPQAQAPSTTKRNPFALLRKEMDDLVTRFWDGEAECWLTGSFVPSADLTEKENAFEVRMDVPGLEAKDISVQVQGNTLTVSGERKEEKEEKGKKFHRIERRAGSFSRTITLPCNVNEDEVAADYVQGVLTLTLPKQDLAGPKKVQVKG